MNQGELKVKLTETLDARLIGDGIVAFDRWSGGTHFIESEFVGLFSSLPRTWHDGVLLRQEVAAALPREGGIAPENQAETFLNELIEAGILLSQ